MDQTMAHSLEGRRVDYFKWGQKLHSANTTGVSMYKSFTLQGIEYTLYDCVYTFREGARETDIGKVVKMWENREKKKKVKIIWFFRPIDVSSFLRDYEPSWNELFLASGEGKEVKGLSNIIPLEAIIGKCNIVCTSKDSRNVLPSKSDLGKAEYYFSHTFDVASFKVSERFPDQIDDIKVECLFNRRKVTAKVNVESRHGFVAGVASEMKERVGLSTGDMVKGCEVGASEANDVKKESSLNEETSRTSGHLGQCVSENQSFKKRKFLLVEAADCAKLLQPKVEDPTSILDPLPTDASKSPLKDPSDSCSTDHYNGICKKDGLPAAKQSLVKTNDLAAATSQRPDAQSWFCKLSMEERIKDARERKTLVYLDNLDPSYAPSDVQDIISSAFKIRADVKLIPSASFCKFSSGKALVVFRSKHDADLVISELTEKCLIVGDRRPIVACRSGLGGPDKPGSFHGHLSINRKMTKNWSDQRNAVSTSHCAQPNTIEYAMGLQWRVLQSRSELWWKALHKAQANEISKWLNKLQKHHEPSATEPSATAAASKSIPGAVCATITVK